MHNQVIQPYQFGHEFSKKTLLWLKGLPNLIPTEIKTNYKPYLPSNTGGGKRGQKFQFVSISKKRKLKNLSRHRKGYGRTMGKGYGYMRRAVEQQRKINEMTVKKIKK